MGHLESSAGFLAFEAGDGLELAKTMQYDIDMTEDPTEASLKSGSALAAIYGIDDRRFRQGAFITAHVLEAFIMDVIYDEETGQKATAMLDPMTVQGESAGMSFIQNLGKPRIQTLFLAIRNARTLEVSTKGDQLWVAKLGSQPLVLPVLSIEALTTRAA